MERTQYDKTSEDIFKLYNSNSPDMLNDPETNGQEDIQIAEYKPKQADKQEHDRRASSPNRDDMPAEKNGSPINLAVIVASAVFVFILILTAAYFLWKLMRQSSKKKINNLPHKMNI